MVTEISQFANTPEILSDNESGRSKESERQLFRSFQKIFEQTDQSLKKADQAILEANTGGNVSLHEVMIALEKADISLRFMVQVRNKAIDAYNEIMRMQV